MRHSKTNKIKKPIKEIKLNIIDDCEQLFMQAEDTFDVLVSFNTFPVANGTSREGTSFGDENEMTNSSEDSDVSSWVKFRGKMI